MYRARRDLRIANGNRRSARTDTKDGPQIDEHFTILEEGKHDIVAVPSAARSPCKPIPSVARNEKHMNGNDQVHKMPSGPEKEDQTAFDRGESVGARSVIPRGLTRRYGKRISRRKGDDRDQR
jgi:hypothetical protein